MLKPRDSGFVDDFPVGVRIIKLVISSANLQKKKQTNKPTKADKM